MTASGNADADGVPDLRFTLLQPKDETMMSHHSENSSMPPSRLKRALIFTLPVTAVMLIAWIFFADQMTSAQGRRTPEDRWMPNPVIETTYAEVIEGATVQNVPRQRVVYAPVVSGPMTQTVNGFTRKEPLPHEKEVGNLVQNILGHPNRFIVQGQQSKLTSALNKDEQKEQLESMLGDQFDAMHARQKIEMDQLAERLETLKGQHQARAEARDEIIRRRMNELLRQPDPMAWDPRSSQRINVNEFPRAVGASDARREFGTVYPELSDTADPPPWTAGERPSRRGVATTAQSTQKIRRNYTITPDGFRDDVLPMQSTVNPSAGEAAIKKAIEDLYVAIGRSSVEQNEKTSRQIQESVKTAEKTIKDASDWTELQRGGLSKAAIEKQISELREVLDAAAETMDQSTDRDLKDATSPSGSRKVDSREPAGL